MQTATLSRRVRNSIVTKSRCRHAPRQRVASHNTHSCKWAASASRWAPRPDTLPHTTRTSLCASLRMQHRLRVNRCRRFVASLATRLHACCARLREHVRVCSRVGLTLRVQAEPASLLLVRRQSLRTVPRVARGCSASLRPGHRPRAGRQGGNANARPLRPSERTSLRPLPKREAPPSGLRPDTPIPRLLTLSLAGADTRSRLKPNRIIGTRSA